YESPRHCGERSGEAMPLSTNDELQSICDRAAMRLYPLLRPLIFRLDAERAHRATIAALKLLPQRRPPRFPPSLTTSVAGIGFPSPVGLAAGFDKDAEVAQAMLGLGF